MLIYFTFLESCFLSVLRLGRAWPASQARASFSRRFSKARFCTNTAGQLFLLLYFLL